MQNLWTNLTFLCHICWKVCSPNVTHVCFPVMLVNRDGCHMWDRNCSRFPEHLLSLQCFYPFIVPNLSVFNMTRVNDSGLFAWMLVWLLCLGLILIVTHCPSNRNSLPEQTGHDVDRTQPDEVIRSGVDRHRPGVTRHDHRVDRTLVHELLVTRIPIEVRRQKTWQKRS